jgi:hypothetical protein
MQEHAERRRSEHIDVVRIIGPLIKVGNQFNINGTSKHKRRRRVAAYTRIQG